MADQYIVFILDDQRYALHLPAVEKVVRMVHITPLASAPNIVLGVVSLQGRLTPVINLRQRFNLPEREIALTDLLIFAHMERRPVALVADAVTEVVECLEHNLISAEEILPELKYLEGIIKFNDGLILIHNLDKFLSLEEEESLDLALNAP
jgi:purine-binding chemotaxis protein CheW